MTQKNHNAIIENRRAIAALCGNLKTKMEKSNKKLDNRIEYLHVKIDTLSERLKNLKPSE